MSKILYRRRNGKGRRLEILSDDPNKDGVTEDFGVEQHYSLEIVLFTYGCSNLASISFTFSLDFTSS